MVEASVELILVGVLGSDSGEIVCRAGARRIRITLQQLRGDRIESIYRDQITRIGAMIGGTKDLAYSRLNRFAVRVDDVYWIGRHRRRYRTVRLKEEKRAKAG